MTRENRLIVTLVGIGLAGAGALAFLAHRLPSVPQKSVHDVAAPLGSAPASATTAVPTVAAGREQPAVEAYLAARQATSAVLAKHPYKAKHIEAMVTGDYGFVKGQKVGADVDVLTEYRTARIDALVSAGGSETEYEAVRAAYRQWKSGGRIDDAVAKVFEGKREDLAKAEMGRMELFDDQVK